MSNAIPSTQTQLVLLRRPKGPIDPSLGGNGTFGKKSAPVPKASSLKSGEVLIAVEFLSLDPAMRGWLNDSRSYIPPVQIGAVMRAGGIGRVVAVGSGVDSLRVGDRVNATPGWCEYAVVPAKECTKLSPPPGVQLSWYLGTLGMPGQTAYWGLLDITKPKKGELCVVTGAAGAVGSLVCQIAKIKGCRVVGIAGGEDKCHWLRQELGIEAIDYKSSSFTAEFKKIGYLDIMFDNVGGDILNLALTRLKKGARISLCGAISDYNATAPPKGLSQYLNLISQRASITGFIVFDYASRYAEAEKEIAGWIADGRVKVRETRIEGLESCVEGLVGLFKGSNTGKLVVKVGGGANKL